MKASQPSQTAQGAALHRAAHQLVDQPPIFVDPLALRIVGEEACAELRAGRERHGLKDAAPLRAFIAVRSRFAEDCLAESYAAGVRQYVLLGAGLDTFAYERARGFAGLAVFEIDHPATQAWKRARLAEAGIAIPPGVTYAPVDFECETLREGLQRAGFSFAEPAWFAWLGVTPYLSEEVIAATLSIIASFPPRSGVVFDYAVLPRDQAVLRHSRFTELAERVAAAGEPFKSLFPPGKMSELVRVAGFPHIEDLDAQKLNTLYFQNRTDKLKLLGLGRLMKASL
jgi:methyltransferase (TIGR00027 family)